MIGPDPNKIYPNEKIKQVVLSLIHIFRSKTIRRTQINPRTSSKKEWFPVNLKSSTLQTAS